ncbi:hypothetical protein ACHWQZ_G002824 [Mnemiopsis leidyi]
MYETNMDLGRSTLTPIREEKDLDELRKLRTKVEFEEKLEELERSLSWRKLAKCMRWTSALANTIFILLAITVMVFSLLIMSEIRVFIPRLENLVLAAVGIVFAAGILILFVSSLGLYGSIKANPLVLILYIAAVLPVLTGELALCCIAWFQQGTLKDLLDNLLKTLFSHYGDTTASLGITSTLVLDAVQIWASCCGNSTAADWENENVATYWANSTEAKIKYPDSCCNKTTLIDGTFESELPDSDSLYHNCSQNSIAQFLPYYFNDKGCYMEIVGTIKTYLFWVTGILFFLAVAQTTIIFVNTTLYFRKHPKSKEDIKGRARRLRDKARRRTVNLKHV